MRLTDEQLADFGRDGFLNAGRVFSEGELAEIAGEYDRLVTAEAQTLGNDRDGRYPYRAMMQFRSPALRSYINHPELIELGLGVVATTGGAVDVGVSPLPLAEHRVRFCHYCRHYVRILYLILVKLYFILYVG